MKRILIILCFSLFIASHCDFFVDGQKMCDASNTNDATGKNAFPNIFEITELSYTLTVEANLKNEQKTFYVTEAYDKEFARGKVDSLYAGKTTSFLYFNETAEIFTIADDTCTTSDMNKKYDLPFDQFNVYKWKGDDLKQPILGPSNMLRFAYQQSLNGLVYKESETQVVRGIKTNVWKFCDNGKKLTVRYFFVDSQTESGFGIHGKPVPARVTVEGVMDDPTNKQISHTYDFVNYQIFVPDIANAFKIPKAMGCKRLAIDSKSVPSVEGKDFYMEAEVVYTPFNGNINFSYVNTIKLAMDIKSQHLAFEFNTWKSHKDAEMAQPGDDVKIVWDIRNSFKYEIDQSYESCMVDKEDLVPTLKFPDEQILNLLSADLFIRDNLTRRDYHYLGDDTERGIPVSVFEKTLQDMTNDDFDDVIITRYHLADDTFENTDFTENNAPIKIVYSNVNVNGKFNGIVVFNIYAFTTRVTNKRELFDVTPCFQGNDQSKWVQLTFPMRDIKPDTVIPHIPFIEDNFLDLLGAPLTISPLRIPKIMVDVDTTNIYVTFLLLERPDFTLDFESQGKFEITDTSLTQGITTELQCAKACLEREPCEAFSYCGAICNLADNLPDHGGQRQNDACEIFQRDRYSFKSISTMDEITASIASRIEFGSIQLLLPGPPDGMIFIAVGFKDGIAFGINGINNRREDNIGSRLSVVKTGYKFDETVANLVKPLGVQSFDTCRRLCLNNPECQSLSFCQASSECSLSSLHEEEIKKDHIQENWQCEIMSRNYVDLFERFPGLVLAQSFQKSLNISTDQGCAKACLDEKSFKCLSFDFCYNSPKPDESCLLHAEHFLNINKDERKVVINGQQCGHYSKKMIYDFEADLGNQIDGEGSINIEDVNVEECAKYCLEDTKINCQAFDWCQTGPIVSQTRKCRLFSKSKAQLVKKQNAQCKIYSRLITKSNLLSPRKVSARRSQMLKRLRRATRVQRK